MTNPMQTESGKNNEYDHLLVEAVCKGKTRKIKKYVKKGADVNAVTDKGLSVLLYAAEAEDKRSVKKLLEFGADIHFQEPEKGQTALHLACSAGHQKIAAILLENGAEINFRNNLGVTVLMYAAYMLELDFVRMLVEHGADVNAADDKGLSVLMYAAAYYESISLSIHGRPDKAPLIEYLLASGADIDHRNSIGKTILMRTALQGDLQTAEILLKNGADTNILCDSDYHVLDYAASTTLDSEEMTALMKKYGAKLDHFIYGYKVQKGCPDCGKTVVINGPAQKVKCEACQSKLSLDNEFWKSFFESASGLGRTVKLMFSELDIDFGKKKPLCVKCDEPLDLSGFDTKKQISCKNCNEKNSSFPAPEWLKKFKVSDCHPEHIFCADDQESGSSEQSENVKPIAINCVSCAASLTITTETSRNTVCRHCETKQYLPDGLWLALHPVKKSHYWFIRFARE
jgi:ankyrin repeat protein